MNRTALITGASRGIGMHTAVELSRRGWRIFAGVRSPDNTAALDTACNDAGVKVEKISLDVTSQHSIEAVVQYVHSVGGGPNLLVNNAGVLFPRAFECLPVEQFEETLRTNFFGAVALTRAVLPSMRERRRGTIINVSSIAGFSGYPMHSAYAASKWALEGFSESLRYEVASFGVNVVLIEPGSFSTDILQQYFVPLNDESAAQPEQSLLPYSVAERQMAKTFKQQIAPRSGDPRKVAKTIAEVAEHRKPRLRYLVGNDARFLKLLRLLLPAQQYQNAVVKNMIANS